MNHAYHHLEIPLKLKEISEKRIILTVENPNGKNSGIGLMEVNGNKVKSNFINPDDFSEKEINVRIVLK